MLKPEKKRKANVIQSRQPYTSVRSLIPNPRRVPDKLLGVYQPVKLHHTHHTVFTQHPLLHPKLHNTKRQLPPTLLTLPHRHAIIRPTRRTLTHPLLNLVLHLRMQMRPFRLRFLEHVVRPIRFLHRISGLDFAWRGISQVYELCIGIGAPAKFWCFAGRRCGLACTFEGSALGGGHVSHLECYGGFAAWVALGC